MKGGNRQHGVVRSYNTSQPLLAKERYEKMVDSATATRLFAKVTTQSKSAGKCHKAWCSDHHHKHAVCKSRDKTKGTMKIKSIDSDKELTKFSFGTSATGVLAYLANEETYNDDDYDYEGRVEETYSHAYGYDYGYDDDDDNHHDLDHDDDDGTHGIDLRGGFAIGIGIVADVYRNDVDVNEDYDDVEIDDDDDDDDDDDTMSFCDVGLCWGHGDGDEYGDDGWYLVGGQME